MDTLPVKKFYRVCNAQTTQGLWYDEKGTHTGLIHNKFNFCFNKDLAMEFDPEIVGFLSVADSLQGLLKWFPEEDILKLQKHDYFLVQYLSTDYKFYERFQHYIINKDTSTLHNIIVL